ncbi:MAG: sigma 54-interacting transcriptional regulator [Sandaracinaceae bacterium]
MDRDLPSATRGDSAPSRPLSAVGDRGTRTEEPGGTATPAAERIVEATTASPGQGAVCVGREEELRRLTSLYREAQRGRSISRLVLIEGPSGIGKTRILNEFRSRVRLEGGVVLEGRCETGRAFGPFAEIVDRALRFLEEVGRTPTSDIAGLACREGCHRLWHQHVAAGEDSASTTDDVPGATPETAAFEKRLRFFDAVAALLREVAAVRAPLMLIHHLEKADRGTVQLLSFLLEHAPVLPDLSEDGLRGLFVASFRSAAPEGSAAPLAAIREHGRTLRLTVGVLNQDGVRAYLQSPHTIQRILARTGGVPEAIDLLLEGQPLTPEDRLAQRLADLPGEARAMVEALAVFDRPADLDELMSVAGVHPEGATKQAFVSCALLTRAIVGSRVLFSFEREVDAERTYRMLSAERQRALHAKCADACSDSVNLQEAVRHALAAGVTDRAVDLAVVAAAALSARHAHGEAAALLESVHEALTPTTPVHLREMLSDLYRVAGAYRKALRHARAVSALSPQDPSVLKRLGHLLTVAGEHAEAQRVLMRAHELAAEDARVRAEVEAELAELHYQRADFEEAETWASRALDAGTRAGDLPIAIQARNALGKLALAQKDPAAASSFFEENRAQAAHDGLGHQEAQAHTNLGVALLVARDLRGAEQACRRAIDVACRVSDTRDKAIATENLAVLAHLRRDYREALGHYQAAVGLLKRLGNRPLLARVANNLGELYHSLGDRSRARAMCDFAARLGGPVLPRTVLGEGLLLRGRIDAVDGDVSAARQAFEEAEVVFRQLSYKRAAEVTLELARLDLVDGDVAAARRRLRELPAFENPKRRAELALVAVDVERAAGHEHVQGARGAVDLAVAAEDRELLLQALLRHSRALADAGEIGLAVRVLERAQRTEDELTARVPEECLGAWAERPLRREMARVASLVSAEWTASHHRSTPPPAPLTRSTRAPRVDGATRWRRRYPSLVGTSAAMAQVFGILDKVAGADALVLVRGESGTGKELIAEAVHGNSPRRGRPLVKVNCAALVETLLLSELFGHERGAFTGANARKKGRFELADGGTLFLDEIGEISPKTQVALLRVLQEREFERVGGTAPIKVDVRIIAATNRDLEQMVRDGEFREDLYYRLRGVTVEMPPLRERLDDLPVLVDHLLARVAEERGEPRKVLAPEAVELLGRHRWPGNIRELENVLRSATLFAEGMTLVPDDFAAFAEGFEPAAASEGVDPGRNGAAAAANGAPRARLESMLYERVRDGETSLLEMKKVMERECIVRALEETDGNITKAASLLGMKRPRLSQLVKQYSLQKLKAKG